MRKNPWLKDYLYFRYGFWDLEPNRNMIYHVTPKLSAIMESTELSPRASRKSKVEGLGGQHDISISVYGSLNRAMYTLVYLYRIWQVKSGQVSMRDIADIAGWDDEMLGLIGKYQPHEIVSQVRIALRAPDPIVMGSDWADDLADEDFAILAFTNPCKHMYIKDIARLSRRSDDTAIRSFTQQSIVDLRQFAHTFSYFGARSDGLDANMYSQIRNNLRRDEVAVTYADGELPYDYFYRALFGGERYTPSDWYGRDIIEFENITVDLRPQAVPIEDVCIYNQLEQEFRLFRSMPMGDVYRVYTIQDALREARQRNGGVEPFFWDMSYGIEGPQPWSEFELSTWVEPLCKRVASLKPEICVVAQEVYDEWDEDEDEYFGGGICHLIADAIVDYLQGHDIDATEVSSQVGDVHVFTIAYDEDTREACAIDISPHVYESGAGYSWAKIEGVIFEPDHVWVGPVDFEDDLWAG